MAFTSAERVKVREYLGYPAAAAWNNVYLESALDRTGNDADAYAEAQAILARLASVETQIAKMDGLALAARAEDAYLRESRETKIRQQGQREAARLASLIGVDIYKDVFAVGWSGGPLPLG